MVYRLGPFPRLFIMNTQGTLTKHTVVDALIDQLATRRLQNIAYRRLAQRVLAGDQPQRRPQIVPMSIAARTKIAA